MVRKLSAQTALLAALTAVALLCAGLADRLHRQERHVRCPEHGELMHVADSGTEAPLSSLRADDASGGHEDCELGALGTQRALVLPVAVAAAPAIALEAPPAPRLVVWSPSQPLFRLAPKLSPPV